MFFHLQFYNYSLTKQHQKKIKLWEMDLSFWINTFTHLSASVTHYISMDGS